MQEVEVTWGRAIKVWWTLVWRGTLIGVGFGAVLGFTLGLLGVQPELIAPISLIFAIPIGWWVVKMVLEIHYSDFRLALLRKEPDAPVFSP